MCDKVVDDDTNALEFVPGRCKAQEMCGKAVDDYFIALEFVPDQYKTQEIVTKLILIIRFH